mgnify:CR=1 FL=1
MIGHWINGQTLVPEGSRSQPVYNPATGEVCARVALAAGCLRAPIGALAGFRPAVVVCFRAAAVAFFLLAFFVAMNRLLKMIKIHRHFEPVINQHHAFSGDTQRRLRASGLIFSAALA